MFKMINECKFYDWGGNEKLSEIFNNFERTDSIAEVWLGAHPTSSSKIVVNDQVIPLNEYISLNKKDALGERVAASFDELPFLFKILSANKALSIQVHPNKQAALLGYARENEKEISLSATNRNYKDDNHKPEIIYALTSFSAMNGFREIKEIVELIQPLKDHNPHINNFINAPTTLTLQKLFHALLSLEGSELVSLTTKLIDLASSSDGYIWNIIIELSNDFPGDAGLFMPLLLNVIELNPGQAMFLDAETPHAYINGVGLEVMANSDNVLRAGLTSKYIDVEELMANIKFTQQPLSTLYTVSVDNGLYRDFPVPVQDFSFSLYSSTANKQEFHHNGPAILLCISGTIQFISDNELINLEPGYSIFIPACQNNIYYVGNGDFACASVGSQFN